MLVGPARIGQPHIALAQLQRVFRGRVATWSAVMSCDAAPEAVAVNQFIVSMINPRIAARAKMKPFLALHQWRGPNHIDVVLITMRKMPS